MNIGWIVNSFPRFLRRHKIVKFLLFFSPDSRVQLISFNNSSKLFVDIRDPFARSYFFAEGYDPEFFSIARLFLSNGGVFFDVGANFGFCSFGLVGCLARNDIEYHLFEANHDICGLLLKSVQLYPNEAIYINCCCVTDTPGSSMLRLDYNNFGSSFISEEGTQKVANLILDDYIRERSIEKINLLKMDIEGWEVKALRGAIDSLTTGLVEAIYVEVSTENLSRAGFSEAELFSLLRDAGYHLFHVKGVDFESGLADRGKAFTLNVHGYPLMVAKLDNLPGEHLVDILAIHKSSCHLDCL